MSLQHDRVRLTSPLPFHSEEYQFSGVITAISPIELILQADLDANTTKKLDNFKIAIQFSPETTFEISCCAPREVDPKDREGLIVQPASENDRGLIHDLLAKVRKDQHIDICYRSDVESSDRYTGFEEMSFVPEALPEINMSDLDTKTTFLGRVFDYPMLITGMTGGVEKGTFINRRLAKAAERMNIPMGIGSQRMAIDNPEFAPIFDVKKDAPDIFLIGNLGMAQLMEDSYLDRCKKAIDMVQADALAIHLNVIQEAIQVEGDRNFKGVLNRLENLTKNVRVPILIKEVGSGISAKTAMQLRSCGVSAIDVGGRGGTSWGYIEGLRSTTSSTGELGAIFRNWGAPTAFSVCAIRQQIPDIPLVATGGIRNGLTVAKAIALGANLAGIGLPLLRAAMEAEDGPWEVLESFARALKVTMIGTGSKNLSELKHHVCLGHPLRDSFEANVFGRGRH